MKGDRAGRRFPIGMVLWQSLAGRSLLESGNVTWHKPGMRRVLVLGCAGSGKTHLSRRIGRALGLPVVHLDRHYWTADWVEPDTATWKRHVETLAEAPEWVMDGNYGGTLPERLAAADTVILLDLPTWLCLIRVLRRTLAFLGKTRGEDMTPGCAERFDWDFTKYVILYRRRHRPIVLKTLSGYSGTVFVLKNLKSVRRFAAICEIG